MLDGLKLTDAEKTAAVGMANELGPRFNALVRKFIEECDLPDVGRATIAALTLCMVNAAASWAVHADFTRKEWVVYTRSAFQAVEASRV